jgi:hypothetical protein
LQPEKFALQPEKFALQPVNFALQPVMPAVLGSLTQEQPPHGASKLETASSSSSSARDLDPIYSTFLLRFQWWAHLGAFALGLPSVENKIN